MKRKRNFHLDCALLPRFLLGEFLSLFFRLCEKVLEVFEGSNQSSSSASSSSAPPVVPVPLSLLLLASLKLKKNIVYQFRVTTMHCPATNCAIGMYENQDLKRENTIVNLKEQIATNPLWVKHGRLNRNQNWILIKKADSTLSSGYRLWWQNLLKWCTTLSNRSKKMLKWTKKF